MACFAKESALVILSAFPKNPLVEYISPLSVNFLGLVLVRRSELVQESFKVGLGVVLAACLIRRLGFASPMRGKLVGGTLRFILRKCLEGLFFKVKQVDVVFALQEGVEACEVLVQRWLCGEVIHIEERNVEH